MPVFKDAKGNLDVNTLTAREAIVGKVQGAVVLPTYAAADLPTAADNAGMLVHCSNGATAATPCLAYCNGTIWSQVAIGAEVITP